MNLTLTLHCSGRDAFGCTAAMSTGLEYGKPDDALDALRESGRRSGWKPRPIQHGNASVLEVFCSSCERRLQEKAAREQQAQWGVEDHCQAVVDILSLVGVTVSLQDVRSWADEERDLAEEWAGLEYLSASDNDVTRVAKPDFLP